MPSISAGLGNLEVLASVIFFSVCSHKCLGRKFNHGHRPRDHFLLHRLNHLFFVFVVYRNQKHPWYLGRQFNHRYCRLSRNFFIDMGSIASVMFFFCLVTALQSTSCYCFRFV